LPAAEAVLQLNAALSDVVAKPSAPAAVSPEQR